jgi:hypothetical protein
MVAYIEQRADAHRGETEMTKINAAGWMVQDRDGYAIFGVGGTEAEAWAQVADGVGDEMDAERFVAFEASAALIQQVNECGGAIAWAVIDGVACTTDEADLAD